ncbi:hypothetical protein [Streptomyces canus]|uniref:hypothetical protein n=1 Tax=Streptomyces canus TaxID=58343 RepID=UPI0027834E8F|nr:hypothetical protein [Streptomyces canus]MDQ1064618.1 hypothetical protein [Streptomyces canus]
MNHEHQMIIMDLALIGLEDLASPDFDPDITRVKIVDAGGKYYQVLLPDRRGSETVHMSLSRQEVVRAYRRYRRDVAGNLPKPPQPPGLLRGATRLLPSAEREDWLEEQRGYLADLPSRRARWGWVLRQLAAMPRYAYTVRTGREKEAA